MKSYLILNMSELAHRRAMLLREEAQLWDIFSRDLKREAGRQQDEVVRPVTRQPRNMQPTPTGPENEGKLMVGIAEAARMMGIGRSKLYQEISDGRIKVRKAGKRSLIAIVDIQQWCADLP